MVNGYQKRSLLIIGGLIVFAACGGEQSATNNANANLVAKTPPLPAATVDRVAAGKTVYETNCMICHKEDGTGGRITVEGKNLNAHDLTSNRVKRMGDDRMTALIMDGVEDEGMPAFKTKLSEGEMRDVVTYIRNTLQKTAATPK